MTMLRRLRRDNRAVAMTEFALAAPLMLTAGLGGLEAANLAVTHMKISQAAMQIADNASRIGDESVLKDRPISETDIIDLLMGADLQSGNKLDIYKFGRVILSSLETVPGEDQQWIHWQRCMGELNVTSSYGVEGDGPGDPSFVGMGPAGQEVMAMPGDAVMFVEIVYEYQPIITDAWVGDRMIRSTAAFTVRDDRDLTQIHQEDPLEPVDPADCASFERFRTDANERKPGGGWNWSYESRHGGGSTTSSTSSGGGTTTSGGSTTTSGGSTTNSGGSTTTSGGSTTTSGGTSTTSGGGSSGGASSGGASSGGASSGGASSGGASSGGASSGGKGK